MNTEDDNKSSNLGILDEDTFQEETHFEDNNHLHDAEYSEVTLHKNETDEFKAFLEEVIENTQPQLRKINVTQVNEEDIFTSIDKQDGYVKHVKSPVLTKFINEEHRYQSGQHPRDRNTFNTNVDSFQKNMKRNEESIMFTSSSEEGTQMKKINHFQNDSGPSYMCMSFNDLIRSVKAPHLKCKNYLVDVPPIKTRTSATEASRCKLSLRHNKRSSLPFCKYLDRDNNNKLDTFSTSGSFESEKQDVKSLPQYNTRNSESNISNVLNVNQEFFAQCFKNQTPVVKEHKVQHPHEKMSFNGLVSMLQESDKRSNILNESDVVLNKQSTSQRKQASVNVAGALTNKAQKTCCVNKESCNLFHYVEQFSAEKHLDSLPKNYNCERTKDKPSQSKQISKDIILLHDNTQTNLEWKSLEYMCCDKTGHKNIVPTLKTSETGNVCVEATDVQTPIYGIHSLSPQKCHTKCEIHHGTQICTKRNCKKQALSERQLPGEYSSHTSQTLNQNMDVCSVEDVTYQMAVPNQLIQNVSVTNQVEDKYPYMISVPNDKKESEECELSHVRHRPFVPMLEERLTNKRVKAINSLTLKSSEEEITRSVLNISQEVPLGNIGESYSQLSLPSATKSTTPPQSESNRNDLSSRLFSKEILESVVMSFKSNKTVDPNLEGDRVNYFRKDRIKRYRKGNIKIYQIEVAVVTRAPVKERYNRTLSFDDVIDIMSQEFENPSETVEMVTLPRPASFETDATKSECLSTGSADNLLAHEKKIRRGLNIISKDRSLLFTGSDNVLQEHDKNHIIMKIQEVFLQVWNDMSSNKFPQIVLRKQSYDNCIFHENMLQLKPIDQAIMSTIHYNHSQSKLKFCLVMFLLNKIRLLLETNTCLTKREIYYQLKELLAKQSLIDSAINNISCLLNVGPWELNILAQKGLVYGDLKIRFTSGETLNCSIPGVLIPCNLNEIVEIQSRAYFILVVEKEAIYHKLLQEDLPNRLTRPFILITGKGFPDLNTQRFLKKLWIIMSIPVFILVDGDFHGINIMLNYRYGSLRNAHLSPYLAIPNAKWIGVLPSEMVKLGVKREPLSHRERSLITNLMQSPYMVHNPDIKAELKILLENGCKGGIEGLIKNNTFLSEVYLPSKFYYQEYV